MELTLEIDPVPAARPRVTRWSTYYPPRYERFKEEVSLLIRKYPKTLYKGPLKVETIFFKKIPKSTSKKEREVMEGTYCLLNYDLDNLNKGIWDAMNEWIFEDDSQIVILYTEKRWSDSPRILVTIAEL